ncbi:hypothetical protein SO802_016094 [Lithocarpus litseifolius]|uniref:Aminotransferase-like plant mobile domain-containing protein n=1 Tax=Lithocarpus litseifolius TaxID=425828 RepID=A0AAW2CVH8_9ROSI
MEPPLTALNRPPQSSTAGVRCSDWQRFPSTEATRCEIVRPGLEITSLLTQQQNHRLEDIGNGEDLGPLQCRCHSKEMSNIMIQDNRVIDIIKLGGLEGLFRAPSKEIDHCLISALVKPWRPETLTFHLPLGEMSITLEDVEVILGLPIDNEVLVGPTAVEN